MWIIEPAKQKLWSALSGRCILYEPEDKSIYINACKNEINFNWVMSDTGKLQSKMMNGNCLGMANEMIGIKDLNFNAFASSELWGNMNGPEKPILASDPGYFWKSRPGIQE